MTTSKMPAVFIGHGSPMNTLETNRFTEVWRRLGETLPRPKAILMVSAHWYTRGIGVTAMSEPRTIHDFGGFPQALFDVRYPAPGSPELAREVATLLEPLPVTLDQGWGLDHGTWSVLAHIYPEADIPVIQLSMDAQMSPAEHVALARKLNVLREQGVMIMGSGNVVHNLGVIDWSNREGGFDWAVAFNDAIRTAVEAKNVEGLANYPVYPGARLSVPTAEHYLPLLYVMAQADDEDPVSIITDGLVMGSISMLAVQVG